VQQGLLKVLDVRLIKAVPLTWLIDFSANSAYKFRREIPNVYECKIFQ